MARASRKAKASPRDDRVSQPDSVPAPEPAGFGRRLAALGYDSLLLIALWLICSAIVVPLATSESAARSHELTVIADPVRQFVLFPILVLVTWLFYGYFWTRAGQTLGMQTWRLCVLRANGERLRWPDAASRCASACLFPLACGLIAQIAWHSAPGFLISVCLGFLGNYLWMFWSSEQLCWHDQLSGTRVWRLPPEPKNQRARLGWFAEKD